MTTGIARLVSDEVTTDDHRYSPFGGVLSKITVAELWYITRLVCQVRLLPVVAGTAHLASVKRTDGDCRYNPLCVSDEITVDDCRYVTRLAIHLPVIAGTINLV